MLIRKLVLFLFIFSSYGTYAENVDPTALLYSECLRKDKEAFFCMTTIAQHQITVSSREVDYMRGMMLVMNGHPDIYNLKDEKTIEQLKKMAEREVNVRYGCIEDKSIPQLTEVFIKWAKNNPDKLHNPMWRSLTDAYSEAFPPPCI